MHRNAVDAHRHHLRCTCCRVRRIAELMITFIIWQRQPHCAAGHKSVGRTTYHADETRAPWGDGAMVTSQLMHEGKGCEVLRSRLMCSSLLKSIASSLQLSTVTRWQISPASSSSGSSPRRGSGKLAENPQQFCRIQPQFFHRAAKCVGKLRPPRERRMNDPSGPVRPHDAGTNCHFPSPRSLLLVPSKLNRRIDDASPFHQASLAVQLEPDHLYRRTGRGGWVRDGCDARLTEGHGGRGARRCPRLTPSSCYATPCCTAPPQ
mgnify:CR=1 FL=1